jgi:hypothetical protein
MYAFLAPPKKVYIHTLKLFFGKRVNLILETPTSCARCPRDFQDFQA